MVLKKSSCGKVTKLQISFSFHGHHWGWKKKKQICDEKDKDTNSNYIMLTHKLCDVGYYFCRNYTKFLCIKWHENSKSNKNLKQFLECIGI